MVVLAVSVLAAMTYGHENCRVFSRTRSIDLYFVSYGEFGELIMKLLRAALGLCPGLATSRSRAWSVARKVITHKQM